MRSKGLDLTKMPADERINGFRNSPFSLLLAGATITLSYFYLGIVSAVIIFLFFAILRMSKNTWEDFMKIRETPDDNKK
jgi:ABC-type amino acid transport system permease subunit